ncbi:hypothetical protein A3F66_00330 [candidate division TM6 bacterium RIFCSPHIGHO2_12_FULL_32_22]|nr:MAG: hypothetical protein A3F66_00330 [candidate division TM6 bacterium RIFCSPHIGHO2_12_FULL_32_22]
MKKKLILTIFLLSGYVANVESKVAKKVKHDVVIGDQPMQPIMQPLDLDNEIIGSIIGALLMDVEFLESLQNLAAKFQDTVEAKITPERRKAIGDKHPGIKAAYAAVKKVAAAKK